MKRKYQEELQDVLQEKNLEIEFLKAQMLAQKEMRERRERERERELLDEYR